jgi:hypothetical protein
METRTTNADVIRSGKDRANQWWIASNDRCQTADRYTVVAFQISNLIQYLLLEKGNKQHEDYEIRSCHSHVLCGVAGFFGNSNVDATSGKHRPFRRRLRTFGRRRENQSQGVSSSFLIPSRRWELFVLSYGHRLVCRRWRIRAPFRDLFDIQHDWSKIIPYHTHIYFSL